MSSNNHGSSRCLRQRASQSAPPDLVWRRVYASNYRNHTETDEEDISPAEMADIETNIETIDDIPIDAINFMGGPTVLALQANFINSPPHPLVPRNSEEPESRASSSEDEMMTDGSANSDEEGSRASFLSSNTYAARVEELEAQLAAVRARNTQLLQERDQRIARLEQDLNARLHEEGLRVDRAMLDIRGDIMTINEATDQRFADIANQIQQMQETIANSLRRCPGAPPLRIPSPVLQQHEPPTPGGSTEPESSGGGSGSGNSSPGPSRCPDWCRCRAQDPADLFAVPAYNRGRHGSQSSGSSASTVFFLARPRLLLPHADEQQVDPELEQRTQYLYDFVLQDNPLPARQERTQRRYFPLSTEALNIVGPPRPDSLAHLFSDAFYIDETSRPGELTIREMCEEMFACLLHIRAILYALMRSGTPEAYIRSQIPRLRTLSDRLALLRADLRDYDWQVECDRIYDFFAWVEWLTMRINDVILDDRTDGPIPIWTWGAFIQRLRRIVENELQWRGTALTERPIIAALDGSRDRDQRHFQEAVIVIEFTTDVIRTMDLSFSLLEMEGWAFRRYLRTIRAAFPVRDNTAPDALRRGVAARLMPTMYDCIPEYGEDVGDEMFLRDPYGTS